MANLSDYDESPKEGDGYSFETVNEPLPPLDLTGGGTLHGFAGLLHVGG